MISRLLLLLALVIVASQALHAQDFTGTTWIVAFPDTTTNTFDPRYPNLRHPDKAYISIYSAVDNEVRITGEGYVVTKQLSAGRFTTVDLMDSQTPAPEPIATRSNVAYKASFRLETDQPVLVYCYLLTRFGTEAWTPIPVESWGQEYFVAARPGEIANDVSQGGEFDYNKKSKMAPSEIVVIAAYDNTYINIQPNGRLHDTADVTDVLLQAGEIYQVQSFVDTSVFADLQPDLGGSRIQSTRPIGVISGNTRAQTLYFQEGLGQNIFKNMLVEWLTPVALHGMEFVYLPTWDARRPTGTPGEDLSSKRKGEHVRIYATSAGVTKGYSLDNNIGRTDFTISGPGKFREDFIGTPEARYYRTDKPAQAMMNSTAIVKYNGTTQGFGGYIGAQFDGYGAYMVELLPRGQWTSFSPFHVSLPPSGMEHYINVVTDSAHRNDIYYRDGRRFAFNRGAINGTDLVWGTATLAPGEDNYLEGRNGARFTGHVYGIYKGHEEYRPGGAKKEKDEEIQSGPAEDPQILHPSEYEEYLAVAYGYPLAMGRPLPLVPGTGDSIGFESSSYCDGMTITARTINVNPAGIGAITIENVVNARIVTVQRSQGFPTTSATIVLGRIVDTLDASGTLVVADRTGRPHRMPFLLPRAIPTFTIHSVGGAIDLRDVDPDSLVLRDVVVSNALSRAIRIDSITMQKGGQSFRIAAVSRGPFPVDLAVEDSLRVTIEALPLFGNVTNIDSLVIYSGCFRRTLGMSVQTTNPIMSLRNLDFGLFYDTTVTSTQMMRVCNEGSGHLRFFAGPTGEPVTWRDRQSFTIDPADLARFQAARIGSGFCFDLPITFHGRTGGRIVDTARVYANDRVRRSTSRWTVNITPISGVEDDEEATGGVVVRPHPVSGTGTIGFRLERPGTVSLTIVDADGREVARIERTALAAGEQSFEWNASSEAAGIYFYRLVTRESVRSGPIVVVR